MIDPKQLVIKTSRIPGAGKGLFTNVLIPKDTIIIEYVGDIATWKEVKDDFQNAYIYYVNSQHVINAKDRKDALARYINDANGLAKTKGITNNCFFTKNGTRVFVQASKDIPPRGELLVSYGKGYWDTARTNAELEKEANKPAKRKK